MATEDIVETWRQQLIQEGFEKGLKRAFEENVKRGFAKGTAESLLVIYEARFGAMPDDVRGVIEDTHDVATLRGWTQLAGTRSADEVIAAIRAYRPS